MRCFCPNCGAIIDPSQKCCHKCNYEFRVMPQTVINSFKVTNHDRDTNNYDLQPNNMLCSSRHSVERETKLNYRSIVSLVLLIILAVLIVILLWTTFLALDPLLR